MGDPTHYHISDDEPLLRFLKSSQNSTPTLYERLLQADNTNSGGLTRQQYIGVLAGYMVPKADYLSLQRIAGFSENGKGEYV